MAVCHKMPFRAAVLDWAGTMVDFGSFAPVEAFQEIFAEHGVEISSDIARGPMGLPKWNHIKILLQHEDISRQWVELRGAPPTDRDVKALYHGFEPVAAAAAVRCSRLVPGALEMLEALRTRNLKIGSTTGYPRSVMAEVLPAAAGAGYLPDNVVCSDDVPEGRPGPLAMYKCFLDLVVHPAAAVIKVDDTAPGIAEGVAAGCCTVGVALSGNAVGRTPEELAAMGQDEIVSLRARAVAELHAAGANHVIDTVADLPALIDRMVEQGARRRDAVGLLVRREKGKSRPASAARK